MRQPVSQTVINQEIMRTLKVCSKHLHTAHFILNVGTPLTRSDWLFTVAIEPNPSHRRCQVNMCVKDYDYRADLIELTIARRLIE